MSTELTVSQKKRRKHVEEGMRQSINGWYAGFCIMHDEELWKDTHSNFGEYAEDEWGIHSRKAYRLIAAGNVKALLSDQLVTGVKESHVREVADLPPEEAAEVITRAVETAPQGKDGKPKITASHVRNTRNSSEPTSGVAGEGPTGETSADTSAGNSGKAGDGNGRPSPAVKRPKSGSAVVPPERIAAQIRQSYVSPMAREIQHLKGHNRYGELDAALTALCLVIDKIAGSDR